MIDVCKGKPTLLLEGVMLLAGFTIGDIWNAFYRSSPRKRQETKPHIVFDAVTLMSFTKPSHLREIRLARTVARLFGFFKEL